jgi:hypothetical protein
MYAWKYGCSKHGMPFHRRASFMDLRNAAYQMPLMGARKTFCGRGSLSIMIVMTVSIARQGISVRNRPGSKKKIAMNYQQKELEGRTRLCQQKALLCLSVASTDLDETWTTATPSQHIFDQIYTIHVDVLLGLS